MSLIFYLLLLFLGYCLYKLYKYKQYDTLTYLVAWSVTTNYQSAPSILPGLDLIDYIHRAQKNLEIPVSCLFTSSELDFVDLILKEYQRTLTLKYFNYSLQPPGRKQKISGEQYFMYMLCKMLKQHWSDSHYLGHNMHEKTLSHNGDFRNYDAVYALSDFAVTYYKLYYVTYLFCHSDPVLNQSDDYSDPDHIRDIIDNRKISIWCYT